MTAAAAVSLALPLAAATSAERQPWRLKRISALREQTHACQDRLGLPRTPVSAATPQGRAYRGWIVRLWAARRDAYCGALEALTYDVAAAARLVFGSYAAQAISVSQCEAHLSIDAENGQYLGAWQMGSSERATYGHGDTAYEQARAAWRYFDASGRDWSPWQCRPDGSLAW